MLCFTVTELKNLQFLANPESTSEPWSTVSQGTAKSEVELGIRSCALARGEKNREPTGEKDLRIKERPIIGLNPRSQILEKSAPPLHLRYRLDFQQLQCLSFYLLTQRYLLGRIPLKLL